MRFILCSFVWTHRSANCEESSSGLQLCNASAGTTIPERRYNLLERLMEADSFARGPGNFAESPKDRMDAFSEILSGVKLNGAVFFSAEFSAPWGFSTPASNMLADEIAPGAAYLVLFHFLIDGGAFVQLTDGPSIELKPGDIVI